MSASVQQPALPVMGVNPTTNYRTLGPSGSSRSEFVTKKTFRNISAITRVLCRCLAGAARRALRLLGIDDPLSGRDVYQFYESVIAYLNWRIQSQRRKFVSWRNQPPEIGNLVHAINILNQILHSGQLAQVRTAEEIQLRVELGELLDRARAANRPDIVYKKSVQKVLARKAAA